MSSMSSNDQTEIESRISKEIRKRLDWISCVPAWKAWPLLCIRCSLKDLQIFRES
jgi:hypothetical protein